MSTTYDMNTFLQELITITKNVVVTAPSVGDKTPKERTVYLYSPSGNHWYDSLRDKDVENFVSKEDFQLLYNLNHSTDLSPDRINYITMRIIVAYWPKIFNQKYYLSVTNDTFVGVSCGNLLLKIHTLEQSKEYIKNRPNQSEIIIP